MTSEYAVFCRENPKLATAMEIARTSHRAGMEGAKFGAIIGGCITLLKNSLALAQDEKTAKEALVDMATDTAKAGAMGYATALAGAAIKGGMQQSGTPALRTLANTSAPTLALNVCLSLGQSVKRYVTGEISEAELLTEVGEKGAGMLSSGMMAALGQLAIPIPFVGAAIGGMIGYSLSTLFYQSALDAATAAETSRETWNACARHPGRGPRQHRRATGIRGRLPAPGDAATAPASPAAACRGRHAESRGHQCVFSRHR